VQGCFFCAVDPGSSHADYVQLPIKPVLAEPAEY
jgi:hypothetical protein